MGAGFFHLLGLAYEVLRRRQGLGEGDAAVAGLLGAFIGWQGLLPMVGLAAALGLVAAVPLLASGRRTAQTPIPFVPFLCAAAMAVYLARLHGWPLPGSLG
jgi:prepilin signal peptidase PulO-like enzyme (type II secretory pathway)